MNKYTFVTITNVALIAGTVALVIYGHPWFALLCILCLSIPSE